MPVKDGPSCPGCGLPNYSGMCPHCRGDQLAYEDELVPPFESSMKPPTSLSGAFTYVARCRNCDGATGIVVDEPPVATDHIIETLTKWLGRGDYLERIPVEAARQSRICSCPSPSEKLADRG